MNQNERFTQRKFTRRRVLEMGGASAFVLATAVFSSPANADQLSSSDKSAKTELTYTADTAKWAIEKSYTSDFTGSEDYRLHNIIAGSNGLNNYFWNFDGTKDKDGNLNKVGTNLIKPGESFSINSVLGEVNDYVMGWAIGPDLEHIPVYGGGICQIPTTMFVASLNAGLSTKDRTNHSYYNGWYFGEDLNAPKEFGMDATVYIPGTDLVIRNTYGYPIRFFFKVRNEHLTAEVYGPPELKPYYVEPLIPRFDGRIPQLEGENRPVKDAGRYPWAVRTVVNQVVWKNESKKELIFRDKIKSTYQSSPYG